MAHAWRQALRIAASRSGPYPEAPGTDSILRLLWPHLLDCVARLQPDQATPAATALFSSGVSHGLTPRERTVVAAIAQGKTDAEIGRALGISPRTVGKHVEHILEKTGGETRTAAVAAIHAA